MTAIRRALLCFAIAAVLPTGAPADDYPANRAYAVRSETLSIIDEGTFQSLGTRALPEGKVLFSWKNADKSRLGLILQDGLIGNLPVSLVVVDLANDKIVNTVKLGYDASQFRTSEDGSRAYMLLGGKVFRGKESVIAVEIASGTVVAQTEIRRAPDDLFLTDGGRKLVFVRKGLNALKASQRRPARLEPFDADTLEPLKAIDLPGPIRSMYLDAPGRVYFLYRGVDHQKKAHRAQGELYVVDRATLELKASLEVGMAPGQMAWDAERGMFYLLTSPWATQNRAAAQLHLIGGDRIAASIELPRRPLGAQPSQDRRHFYVLYEDDIVRVDRDLTKAEKTLALKDSPVQLFEHPDSGFFYALHYDSAYVSVVNSATGKTMDRVKSGRNKKRVAKLAAAGAAQVAAAGLAVATGPSYTVNDTAYYHVPVVNPMGFGQEKQYTHGSFSEDAKFLYVYNSWTDDVTVIETGTHKIVKKVPGGEYGLKIVDEGRLLCTWSAGVVRLFDTTDGFEMTAKYDGVFSDVTEVAGKRKLYLSQQLGRPVAVVDLGTPGEAAKIAGTAGKIIRTAGD